MKLTKKQIIEISTNPTKYADKISTCELVELLKYLSEKNFDTGPIVDDTVYDILLGVLEKRDPSNSFLKSIGTPNLKNAVKLPYPMASLDKIKADNSKALNLWISKHPGKYIISDKLDGVSAMLVIHNQVMELYTRGDSENGRNISCAIKNLIGCKMMKRMNKLNIAVRGEIVISKKNFLEISDKYKNSRNAVPGILTKMIPEYLELLDFVAYEIVNPNFTKKKQFLALQKIGMNIVENIESSTLSVEILDNYLVSRKELGKYMIDGLVVSHASSKSVSKNTNPKHSFAYKKTFDYQKAQTEIIKVIWNKSMYGYLIPKIEIKPVEISGTTITYATAHNAKFVVDNILGPGAKITIIRSGDVIPKILEVLTSANKPSMPNIKYVWDETKVHIIASDNKTQDMHLKRLTHFFSELKVKFLSKETIRKFILAGINTIEKILLFDPNDIYEIEGLGKKSVEKIKLSMNTSIKNASIEQYMSGSLMFGRGFGIERSKLLMSQYPDIFTGKYGKNELYNMALQISGFGDVVATQFVNGYDKFMKLYEFLENNNMINKPTTIKKNASKTKILKDQIIVFTGFRDDKLTEKIVNLGGVVKSTASKKTTILVYDNKKNTDITSKKFITAQNNGTTIISKHDFVKLYINKTSNVNDSNN